nr:hypothetical protein [Tanacetum cinerariifolium]
MDIEPDEEEEEENPAPADSVVVALTAADQAPSAKETEPFETDESAATPSPHPAYRMTARISIPTPVPVPAWSDSKIVRLLAMSSPPSSPLSPWSSLPPQIPENRPEVTLPPRKRLGIALGPGHEVGKSSSAAAARPTGGLRAKYGFVATIDREIMRDPERGWLWDHRIVGRDSGDLTGSTNASDLVRGEVISLRTTVLDHRRSTEIIELRTALQGQAAALAVLKPEHLKVDKAKSE